jgi:hypothetical protein
MVGGVMERTEAHIPLGLLFEEPASLLQDMVAPTYDEETDLSYVVYSGRRVPWAGIVEAVATNTGTNSKKPFNAGSEADNRLCVLIRESLIGTETITKIVNRSTDTD